MADIKASEHNASKKPEYHNISVKSISKNLPAEIVVKMLNNETYPLVKLDCGKERSYNFNKCDIVTRIILILLFTCVMITFLIYFGIPLLYVIMNLLYMSIGNYDTEIQYTYNEKTIYQHTSDIYIEQQEYDYEIWPSEKENALSGKNATFEQQEYDYKILPLKKENALPEKNTTFNNAQQCTNVPEILRFDCHPEDGASQLSCTERGCCWNPLSRNKTTKHMQLYIPYCYYPSEWKLYKYVNYSQDGSNFLGFLSQEKKSVYKNDVPLVKIEATGIDNSLLRVKIYDPLKTRYEPPWPIRSDPKPFLTQVTDKKYHFNNDDVKPGFKIERISDGTTLFNTIGGFIFADQFLQISTLLPTSNIYGIGEHRSNLKLNTNWQSFTLFNKDQPPTENANLYGSHPFYIVVEDSGMAHGVLFLNSNAMDVILQPTPAITFRAIGGIFDIYFFLGPTPADVVRQYSEFVGKPFMPPYWSLGFHLCRFGYGTLENTKAVWNRTRAAGIPFDTQWNDLDYMDKNNDFTYNKERFKDLPKFVEELHSAGMHYIPLIDAGISASEENGSYLPYDEGIKRDIFIKDGTSNKPFFGKVWNLVSTVWPDFTNPKTMDYYASMMGDMHNSFTYDGAWIDMNEPSNFYDGHKNGCTHNNLDYPEYVPNVIDNLLATKTLCMNAKHYLGSHYDLHNTYGISQAIATNYALRKIRQKRPFIISRSTWIGHGHYAGHWTGDVYSLWHDLRMSIPAILSFNFYQIPMVGADICGFNGNTTAALCNRWMQLGAFYPFSRNHNSDDTIEQDPVAMGNLVVQSSKNALRIRYRLLPYLYTLFFRAHKFGETVARPLFFEFTNDRQTYDIDTQFLWGSSLMINPVLEENKTAIAIYVPRGLWYDYYSLRSFFSIGKHYTLSAPIDRIPLLIRGGSILPAQKPSMTTTESRKNNFELIVALDEIGKAKGELYWDDGDSIDSVKKKEYLWLSFTANKSNLLNTEVDKGSFNEEVILGKVQILGLQEEISRVFLNKNEIVFKYDVFTSSLTMTDLQVDMKQPFVFYWIFEESDDKQYY